MTAVHHQNNKILYPPPTFQAVAGRLLCSTSPLAITSPGFSDAPIQADIVFLPDNRVCRKVTYRLYPTSTQEEGLWKRLWLHFILYNGGLQERISAWRHSDRISITFQDQCRSLTDIRAFDEDFASLNAQSEQVTLKRLDLAFQAFFRRVKAGETPGFPRFKSFRRFPGWGYKTRGDGWDFEPGENGTHGKLLGGSNSFTLAANSGSLVPTDEEWDHKMDFVVYMILACGAFIIFCFVITTML